MYKCNSCDRIFDEPESKRICLEIEYGVASLFDNMNYTNILVCPYCNESNFKEVELCIQCGKYFEKYNIENEICYECKENN